MCSEEHILLLFAFQNPFFFFFWSVTVPYPFDIHSVPILCLFRSRSHIRSVSVLYPVAFAFPVRFLLSGTVHCKPRLHVSVNPLFGVWPPIVARLRCRRCCRRAYAPMSNTANHDNHEKINSWVSFCFPYEYGAPLKYLIWQSSCCFLDPDTWITEFPNYTWLYIACTCTCTIKGSILEWSLVTSNA